MRCVALLQPLELDLDRGFQRFCQTERVRPGVLRIHVLYAGVNLGNVPDNLLWPALNSRGQGSTLLY